MLEIWWRIGKNSEGGGCGVFQGTNRVFLEHWFAYHKWSREFFFLYYCIVRMLCSFQCLSVKWHDFIIATYYNKWIELISLQADIRQGTVVMFSLLICNKILNTILLRMAKLFSKYTINTRSYTLYAMLHSIRCLLGWKLPTFPHPVLPPSTFFR
jgi:hypothetical protein